jgi:hypothetical protein
MPADSEPTLRPEIAHIHSLEVVGYSKLIANQQDDLSRATESSPPQDTRPSPRNEPFVANLRGDSRWNGLLSFMDGSDDQLK